MIIIFNSNEEVRHVYTHPTWELFRDDLNNIILKVNSDIYKINNEKDRYIQLDCNHDADYNFNIKNIEGTDEYIFTNSSEGYELQLRFDELESNNAIKDYFGNFGN